MVELAYTSTAAWSYSDADLEDILTKSRANNLRDGITGILLYRSKTVLQLLEGDELAVGALYAKLLADKRHHSLLQLYHHPIDERRFGQWSMAFEHLSEKEASAADVHLMTGVGLVPDLKTTASRRQLVDTFLRCVR